MKRVVLLLIVLCVSAPAAWADYFDPPGWDDNPYFTHQSWEFNTDQNPLGPDSVTNPVNNQFGSPLGIITVPSQPAPYGAMWIDDVNTMLPGSNRQGAWGFIAYADEGTYDPLTFEIPNVAVDHLKKQIWFQATLWTSNERGEDPDEIYAKLYDHLGNEHDYIDREVVPFGDPIYGAKWVRATYLFEIDPQPPEETLILGAHLFGDPADPMSGETIVLDQVDINTRCIPEPGTIVLLLGLVATCLVGGLWQRRRKR